MKHIVFLDHEHQRVYRDAPEMVNDYIERFTQSVKISPTRLDRDGYCEIQRGSATVGINVLSEHGVLLILSKVIDVPSRNREAFYRRLLELNFLVTRAGAFAIDTDRDAVYLRAQRNLAGLDYVEFRDLMTTMGNVADEWDDRLLELAEREGT